MDPGDGARNYRLVKCRRRGKELGIDNFCLGLLGGVSEIRKGQILGVPT